MRRVVMFVTIVVVVGLIVPLVPGTPMPTAQAAWHRPDTHGALWHFPLRNWPYFNAPKAGRCPAGYRMGQWRGQRGCIKCRTGYFWARYRGVYHCIYCKPGYKYRWFIGRKRCIRCRPGYFFGKYRGKRMCLRCKRGYRWRAARGRCVK